MPDLRQETSVNVCVQRIEQILRDATKMNRDLLGCIVDSQDCLRSADTKRLTSCLKRERELVEAIDALEQRRKVVAATLATALGQSSETEMRLTSLAEALGEPNRSRLLALGEELRESILDVRDAGGVLRDSCENLLGHVSGLMQSIHAGLSRTKVYGSDGRIGVSAAMCGGLDLKT